MWRRGQSTLYVTNFLGHLSGHIAGHIGMHEVLGRRGRLRRDDDRERLVLHLDELGGILRNGAGFGHYERDSLAGIAHYCRSQALLSPAVREVGVRDQQG
jgi:hypothetical protein